MESNIDISIVVASYNHERYIEKALSSILMQRTKYSYEVWIGDDSSTDNTQNILRRLEEQYPDNFHFVLRSKNVGADANFKDLYSRTTGKYLAVLEGDDYWISDNKLQLQVEFLEGHKDYIATAHNVMVIDGDGNVRDDFEYPECKKGEYLLRDFRNGLFAGQTASIVSVNYYYMHLFEIFRPSVNWPGDETRNFMLASYGKVHCFQSCMSAYRYVTEGGSSFSATYKMNEDTQRRFLQYHYELYEYAKNHVKSKESIEITESMYLKYYLAAVVKRKLPNVSLMTWLKLLFRCEYPIRTVKYLFVGN